MVRENRYVVFKRTDLAKIFSEKELEGFETMLEVISTELDKRGIRNRKYVVVEDDWPEYEKVWDMIEERVDA